MDEILNLIAEVKNGSDPAFEKLLEKYQGMVISTTQTYYLKCLDSSKEWEDWLQEAKIAFYYAVKTYDENHSRTLGAYAKICVRNKLVSRLRYLNSQKRKKDNSDTHEQGSEDVVQSSILSSHDIETVKKNARERLSRYEYRIFEMYASGMKGKEISSLIGKSEKSINNAIYRMKQKLIKEP